MIAVEQKEAPVSLDLETPPPYSPRPNAVTLADAREARDIMSGKTQVDWNSPPLHLKVHTHNPIVRGSTAGRVREVRGKKI